MSYAFENISQASCAAENSKFDRDSALHWLEHMSLLEDGTSIETEDELISLMDAVKKVCDQVIEAETKRAAAVKAQFEFMGERIYGSK